MSLKPKVPQEEKDIVNFKNKAQRLKLYERAYMVHNLESRLFTLQQAAINLSSKSGFLALQLTESNLHIFAEAVSEMETMIELSKLSIKPLQNAIIDKRNQKLNHLKKVVDEAEEKAKSEEVKPKAQLTDEEALEVAVKKIKANKEVGNFKDSIPKEKNFFDYLMFWKY